jgi:hypothetical protein
MGLVHPDPHPKVKNTYRAIMTGDYDLWAVFPRVSQFDARARPGKPPGPDVRPVPGSTRFNVPMKIFAQTEVHGIGNISGRVSQIRNELNAAISASGYSGGNMVQHSDEAARPLLKAVELEIIAFIPGQREARFVESMGDLKEFMAEVIKDYYITLNPGWQRQLGFSTTPQGNWEV